MLYILVYEKIIWNDFSRSPAGVSLRDETNKAINNTGHFYDILLCKSPFGPPSAFKNMSGTYFHVTRRALHKEVKCKFDPVKFSEKVGLKAKQHSKKVNGDFHEVKETFCFFAAMRAGRTSFINLHGLRRFKPYSSLYGEVIK